MNLFSIVQEAARRWPDDIAVVHDSRAFRYSDLYGAAESLALKLREAGIKAGDKVGVGCPRSAEHLIAYLAVLRAGGIVVTISPALKAAEVADFARELALDAFCYSAELASRIPPGQEGGAIEASVVAGRAPLWVKLAASRDTLPVERERLLKLNAACIGFSSGTTSKAKAMIFSHATLSARAATRGPMPPITRECSALWLRSMDRNIPHQILGSLLVGGKVIIADTAALEPLARLIREHGVDRIYAGPLFYRRLSYEPLTAEDFRGVKYFVTGGSALSHTVAEAFRERFGRELTQTFGLAECSTVFANLGEDPRKCGSVGRSVPGREVRLESPDSAASDDETIGEILVRGDGIFDGYYRPWQSREEVLEDGWFKTGDLARRDADGYYWIVGRTKEVINVGGVKVFPQELEEILLAHPAVEEAVVYGVAEGRFGEVPHAKVKLRGGATCAEREIMRHVNEKVSVFKSLRRVEFVDEIAKTATGKLKRVSE